jgi:tetratricopeptide (TPR) repeat protein
MSRAAAVALLLLASCQAAPEIPSDPDRLFADTLRAFAENGRTAPALAGLDGVLRARPAWADAHAARADVLLAAGRRSEALAGYDQAIALQPVHLDALRGRGVLLADLGRTVEAERDFRAVIAAVPGAADGYLLRAWLERRTGRYSESERDLAEARSRGPGRWEAYHNAGAAAARMERWSQAARNFELAVLLRPDHADGWIALSRAHAALGLPDLALEDLDRADKERPDNAAVWYTRGELLRLMERPQEALRAYDRAIALRPVAIMYAGRAQARLAANDAPGAEADLVIALDLEPGLREAWVARARWRAATGRYEGARDDYAAALRIRASATILRELARLHHDREQWGQAIAGYESALRICDEPELRPVLERELADARARRK